MPTTPTNWRKSSHSGGEHGDCVEAGSANGTVAIRDTANHTAGTLTLPTATFAAMLTAARENNLNP